MMLLNELRDYNASLLQTNLFKDYCPNGMQVEGREQVRRIATAVTASQQVLDAAIAWGADAILVHHGYFWRNEETTIVGIKKKRIAQLLRNDVSLLAYHLPLDAHAELGNNAQLGKLLGLVEQGRFGEQNIAWLGALAQPQTLTQLTQQIAHDLQRTPQVIGDSNKSIRKVACAANHGRFAG
jgi:dinuclear metal center YbgI/SA1388 family protein